MSEELTGELISKWISFKLYPDSVEEPFFSSEVEIQFTPSNFQITSKRDVKKFLSDFFTQGNSDYSLEVISTKMDIKGNSLEEAMKVAVTSKLSTLKWLCSKELSYYNLTARRIIFSLNMTLQFSKELLTSVIVEWNPQELEESLVDEEPKKETLIEVHEKNDTLVEGPGESADGQVDKESLEPEPKKAESNKTDKDNKINCLEAAQCVAPVEAYENATIDSPDEQSKTKTPEKEEIEDTVNYGSAKKPLIITPQNELEVIENSEKPSVQEGEKAEVDTLVDSEGSVNSRSPVPSRSPVISKAIGSLVSKFENSSQESLSSKPFKKPNSKLTSKSDSKLETKDSLENEPKVATKQLARQNNPLPNNKSSNGKVKSDSRSTKPSTQNQKTITKSSTLPRKEASVASTLKASSKSKDMKAVTKQFPSSVKSSAMSKSAVSSPNKASFNSRSNQFSTGSTKASSPLKSRSASQLPVKKTSRADLTLTSFSAINHLSRPIIRSSLQARNLNTTFTLGNEAEVSDTSKTSPK